MNNKQKTIIFVVVLVIIVAAFLAYSPKGRSSIRGMEDALKKQEVNETTSDFNWQKFLFISIPTLAIGLLSIDALKDNKKEEWEKYLKED